MGIFKKELNLCQAFATVLLTGGIAASAQAQWCNDYNQPFEVATGYRLRAGSILATADGGVMAAYAVNEGLTQNNNWTKYNARGNQGFGDGTYGGIGGSAITGIKLFPHTGFNDFFMATSLAPLDLLDDAAHVGAIQSVSGTDGTYSLKTWLAKWRYLSGTNLSNGSFLTLEFNPIDHTLRSSNDGDASNVTAVKNGTPKDASMLDTGGSTALLCFIQSGFNSESPSRVWAGWTDGLANTLNAAPAEEQGPISQSDAQITRLDSGNYMLSWLGNLNGTRALFAKVVDNHAAEVSPVVKVMDNVIDYKCTTSTLGFSVFAGVTRTGDGILTNDTMFGGLIDPVSNTALTLPFVTRLDVKLKAFEQEANGDFSLVYSVPENGTTLLKVLRVSGTTAEMMWDTTVADLGLATDAFVRDYPNTWVSSSPNSAMYIMTRHDYAYSENTAINLTRLRADGITGADDLKQATNLRVTGYSAGALSLNWEDNSNSEDKYLVGRTLTDISGIELLGMLPENSTDFSDTTAQPGNTYFYYVAPFQEDTGNYVLSESLKVTLTD